MTMTENESIQTIESCDLSLSEFKKIQDHLSNAEFAVKMAP